MRSFSALLTTMVIILIVNVGLASEKSKALELNPEMKPLLVLDLSLTPIWILQEIVIHESTHAIVGKMTGGDVSDFSPYPHLEHVPKGRVFVMGSTRVSWDIDEYSKRKFAMTAAAPMVTNILMFTTTDFILSKIDQQSPIAAIIYPVGMVAPLLNFTWNALCLPGSDMDHVAKTLNAPKWPFIVTGQLLVGVGIWRSVVRFRDIFMRPVSSKETSSNESGIKIMPMIAPNSFGVVGTF